MDVDDSKHSQDSDVEVEGEGLQTDRSAAYCWIWKERSLSKVVSRHFHT